MTLGASEHDGHSAYFDIFPLLYRSVETVLNINARVIEMNTRYRQNMKDWRSWPTVERVYSPW